VVSAVYRSETQMRSRFARLATLDALAWLLGVPLLTAALLAPILGFNGWPDGLLPGEDDKVALAAPAQAPEIERVAAPWDPAAAEAARRAHRRGARRGQQRRRTVTRHGSATPRRRAPAPGQAPARRSEPVQARPAPGTAPARHESPSPRSPAPTDELPPVEVPKVEVPKVELPPVEIPDVELPPIEIPQVKLPQVELPPLETPDLPLPG
jgi:hypothetical protein